MPVEEELATDTLVKTSWKNNYRNNEVHAINR